MNRLVPLLFVFTLIGGGVIFAVGMGELAQSIATFSWALLVVAVLASVAEHRQLAGTKARESRRTRR